MRQSGKQQEGGRQSAGVPGTAKIVQVRFNALGSAWSSAVPQENTRHRKTMEKKNFPVFHHFPGTLAQWNALTAITVAAW
jgi:hypothetical protein